MLAAALSLVVAGVAQATIHAVNSSECAAPPADGTSADTQNPPGVSDPSKSNFLAPLGSVGASGGASVHGDWGDENCLFPELPDRSSAYVREAEDASAVAAIEIPPRAFCVNVTRTLSEASSSASATSSRILTASASQKCPSFR